MPVKGVGGTRMKKGASVVKKEKVDGFWEDEDKLYSFIGEASLLHCLCLSVLYAHDICCSRNAYAQNTKSSKQCEREDRSQYIFSKVCGFFCLFQKQQSPDHSSRIIVLY